MEKSWFTNFTWWKNVCPVPVFPPIGGASGPPNPPASLGGEGSPDPPPQRRGNMSPVRHDTCTMIIVHAFTMILVHSGYVITRASEIRLTLWRVHYTWFIEPTRLMLGSERVLFQIMLRLEFKISQNWTDGQFKNTKKKTWKKQISKNGVMLDRGPLMEAMVLWRTG